MMKLLLLLLALNIYIPALSQSPAQDDMKQLTAFRKAYAQLELAFEYNQGFENSLDPYYVLSQELPLLEKLKEKKKKKVKTKKYLRKDLSIKLVDDDDGFKIIRQNGNEFLESDYQSELNKNLEIISQGEVLHKFRFPVKTAHLLGNHLVFIKENDFNIKKKVQYIHFIDLNFFESALGNTELPVFTLPISSNSELNGELELLNKELKIGEWNFPLKVFDEYSKASQLLYNFNVNLLDPSTYTGTVQLQESFLELLEKSLTDSGEQISLLTNNTKNQALYEEVLVKAKSYINYRTKHGKEKTSDRLKLIDKDILEDSKVQDILKRTQVQQKSQRKLFNRMKLINARLSVPRPMGGSMIRNALGLYYFSKKAQKNKIKVNLRESIAVLSKNRIFKATTLLASTVLFAYQFPELSLTITDQAINSTSKIFNFLYGKVENIGYIASESFDKISAPFRDPGILHKAYIADGKYAKTLIAFSSAAGIIGTTLGLPHLIVNTKKLLNDLSKMGYWRELSESFSNNKGTPSNSKFGTHTKNKIKAILNAPSLLKKYFINRQNIEQKEFLDVLASAYGNPDAILEVDKLRLNRILSEIESETESKPNFLKRAFHKVHKPKKSIEKSSEIKTLRRALMHFAFSFSSFMNSGKAYTRIWNAWFGFRSFVLMPKAGLRLLFYPKYFKRSTQFSSTEGINYPTRYNGGKRVIGTKLFQRLKYNWKSIEKWEEEIIEVEQLIKKKAFELAIKKLPQIMKQDSFAQLLNNGGITNLSSKGLKLISGSSKLFFYRYFVSLYESGMQNFMNDILIKEQGELVNASLNQIKSETLESLRSIDLGTIDMNRLIGQKEKNRAQKETNELIKKNKFHPKRYFVNLERKTLYKLSPDNNMQVNRIVTVEKGINDPLSALRGVRSLIISNIVDKPLEFVTTVILYAAVTTPFLQLVQDQMFGPNSILYMSRYVALNGFVYGTLSGVLSHVWMKIQMDAVNTGNFGKVPEGEELKWSYLKWFRKAGLNAPGNSWKANMLNYIKIITSNLKAGLVTIAVINFATLGRFDLDSYLTGYLLAYILPHTGLLFQVEQAFELSTGYFARKIPKDLRHLPEAQKYIQNKAIKARFKFNLVYRNFENFLGTFTGIFGNMGTEVIGPRSLARTVFGGLTPTEIIQSGFQKVGKTLAFIPGAESAMDKCSLLFTKNYTGFKK